MTLPSHTKTSRNVLLTDLASTPFNPENRTVGIGFEELTESIKTVGILSPLTAVQTRDGLVLVDGNRRKAAAIQAGGEKVPVIVYTPDSPRDADALLKGLFTEMNRALRAWSGAQKLQAALNGGPVFDVQTKSHKVFIESAFKPEEVEFLLSKNVSPTLVNLAKRVVKYVNVGIKTNSDKYTREVRKTAFWMIRHKAQQPVTAYMRSHFAIPALRNAIDKDRPTPRFQVVES